MRNVKIYTKVNNTSPMWITCSNPPPCADCNDPFPSVEELEVLFQEAGCSTPGQEGGYWGTETYSYSILVPTKNDGLLGPKYCRWNSGDNYNDQSHNFYYGDAGTEPGYNHSELKNYKRKYSPREGGVSRPWEPMEDWFYNIYSGE